MESIDPKVPLLFSVKKPFLLLYFLILLGCDYAPEEEYFKVINPPASDDINIKLPEVGDTIYLFSRSLLRYSVEVGTEKPVKLEVFLDDDPVATVSPEEDAFYVDPRSFPTGYYPLRLELTTTGGTGSLADASGLERQKVKKEWTIYMDKTRPGKVAFKDIYPDSGTLMLSWMPYPHRNFQAYELRKFCYNPIYKIYHPCDTLTLTNQFSTKVADSSFVGGKALYKIRVLGSDQYGAYSEKEYSFAYQPEFRWKWLGENELEFRWEANPFYQNVKHYEFDQKNTHSPTITSHLSDTIRYHSFVFGDRVEYELKVEVRVDQERNNLLYETVAHKGEKVHRAIGAAVFNKARDRYYALHGPWQGGPDTLCMINGQSNELEKKLVLGEDAQFSVSPNGEWMYAAFEDQLLQIDPLTLSVQQRYALSELGNQEISLTSYSPIVVNNGNFLILQLNIGYVALDMNHFSIRHETFDQIHLLSPDGSKLFKEGNLYRWNGSQYLEEGPFYQTENLRQMAQYEEDNLILLYQDWFKIVDSQSGLEIKSIPLKYEFGQENIVSYDPAHHLLGQYFEQENNAQTDFEIYDLATDEIQSVRIANSRWYKFKILNKKLICSAGYLLSLE